MHTCIYLRAYLLFFSSLNERQDEEEIAIEIPPEFTPMFPIGRRKSTFRGLYVLGYPLSSGEEDCQRDGKVRRRDLLVRWDSGWKSIIAPLFVRIRF